MSAARKCRGCGTDVPANAPFGHCPKCLLELGFGPVPEGMDMPAAPAAGGERSFGDYDLIEQIGRGGMGVIYKARQLTLNRPVALKLIRPDEFASATLIQRFHLEAEAAANLHHPNIVPIYEIGEHNGKHFFSMELIDGFGLDRYITASGFCFENRPSPRARHEQIARIMTKVARAVDYAHQHGVLHRDLKPSNIILDKQGEPHLTDFGVAKVIGHPGSSLTASGAIMGTPSYMAPEQAAGKSKRVTTAADTYSLGAILYEMLTGSPPFRADTPLETLKQVVEDEPRHPSTLKEGVDHDLAIICMKCLEKEPQRRYSSAAALAEDLERSLRKEPILARPVGALGRVGRWCRREPTVALLVGGIALSLVVVTIAALVAFGHARRAARFADQNQKQTDAHNRVLKEVSQLLSAAQLKRLNDFYESPTEISVMITSEELAPLTGRLPAESNSAQGATRLVMGVYTHTTPAEMFARFAPVLSYLETNVTQFNLRIDLIIYKGYSNLVNALISGSIHLARPGPASYVLARRGNPLLNPVLKQVHDHLAMIDGVIFTRPDTGIVTLEDLKGKSFAFGDRDSTFGNYMAKDALFQAGLKSTDLRSAHWRNHKEVVQKVMSGEFQAGVANSNVVASAIAAGAKLKIIHAMCSVSFPWVATTNLSPPVLNVIFDSLRALKDPAILSKIDSDLTGFVPAQPQDYDDFEEQMQSAGKFEGQ